MPITELRFPALFWRGPFYFQAGLGRAGPEGRGGRAGGWGALEDAGVSH
jgi:hypothetical protein